MMNMGVIVTQVGNTGHCDLIVASTFFYCYFVLTATVFIFCVCEVIKLVLESSSLESPGQITIKFIKPSATINSQ